MYCVMNDFLSETSSKVTLWLTKNTRGFIDAMVLIILEIQYTTLSAYYIATKTHRSLI